MVSGRFLGFLAGLLASLLCIFASGAGAGSLHDIVPIDLNSNIGDVIQLDLGPGKIYDSASYNKAIVFLEDLKGASSCHKLAASTLIQACQSLDQGTAIDVALAEVKEEYAAKVAACELNAVYNKGKDVIPKACKAFLPSRNACPKTAGSEANKLCYAHVTRAQVTACISSLENRPQSWTSYSNALQNVRHTCQASRLAMDKDLMLNQLKSALETFGTATQQTQDVFTAYQAEAQNNLARFQTAHAEVATSIKEDWAKMSEELTQHTWSSYLNMFSDIAKHYGNLTEYFTQSSEVAIAKQDQALEKANRVHDALDNSITTTNDLTNYHKTLHELVSTNNAALLSSQDQLQARSEFLLSLMDVIQLTLTEEAEKLNLVVNSTNELRDLLDESSPLVALITPLAEGLRFAGSAAKAVWYVDVLGVVTVLINGCVGWIVGRKVMGRMEMSVLGGLSALVAIQLLLYLTQLTVSPQLTLFALASTLLRSRLSGFALLSLHLVGFFDISFANIMESVFANLNHRRSAVPVTTRPSTPIRHVTSADPVGREGDPKRRLKDVWADRRGRGRAASEGPRGSAAWE